ncbi:hypothetical protein MKX50_16110 [Paenibacillus sp. FSL W8-0186]|uniref:Lipoprotein n=1 Tax=Paenibacillus woosongensis TaxID=307580 RepID=A0ABQ4MPP7_9BACL|nr:hypothetical protein [Paenibacillus woosongensis]GIP57962.1 hypothetical protein J15TS10_17760 [Paenibacillus woosongensis]
MGLLHRFILASFCLMAAVLMSSCRLQEARTGEQWFNHAWSGLAGVDALTFQGKAALWRGEQGVLEQNLSYSGRLDDHHRLTMRTVIAEGGAGSKGSLLASGTHLGGKYETKLVAQGRRWHIVSDEESLGKGLARLNPLEQLEHIRNARKSIKLESGAARGTKVLRIELDAADAQALIGSELEEEMKQVRQKWESKLAKLQNAERAKLASQSEQIWSAGNKQLAEMLNQAEIQAVYHLTVNSKTGLPMRLTSESRIAYLSPQGVPQQEMLRTDNRFADYK